MSHFVEPLRSFVTCKTAFAASWLLWLHMGYSSGDSRSLLCTLSTGHWFFEDNRPDAYDPDPARLAWQRTVEFLHRTLN